MKNSKYYILFKTGDAEFRCFEKSNFNPESFFPIVELTRGRKSKFDKIGHVSKRIEKLSSIFKNIPICLDLTTDSSLSNSQIDDLYLCDNGYANWVQFIKELNHSDSFKSVIPTILVDTGDEQLSENLLKQVEELSSFCPKIAYRNNIADDGYYEDIQLFADSINRSNKSFVFILDCEYVPSGATYNTIEIAKVRIAKVRKLIPSAQVVVVSTSFPRYVSDIGNDDKDTFPLNELLIFQGLKEQYGDISYGDYASIFPTRNDSVVMSRGWIPRIDVPTIDGIYYYRLRNTQKDYASTYSLVAKKVVSDSRFPHDYEDNWGVRQILMCRNGKAPGSAPSFWISVRMSIFIELQLRRLGLV